MQRILMELLTQMDGFDQTTNVKVIMATNRPEMLDPALMRPGRLDRKVEFPLPDRRQKRLVFQACTAKMNLSEEVDLESFVNRPQKISCADIASICQEAGLQAIRKNRYIVLTKDLEKAYKKVVKRTDSEYEFYSWVVCCIILCGVEVEVEVEVSGSGEWEDSCVECSKKWVNSVWRRMIQRL